nr:MAG TPA: hypothetical protein [Caudoviricetes sp.]
MLSNSLSSNFFLAKFYSALSPSFPPYLPNPYKLSFAACPYPGKSNKASPSLVSISYLSGARLGKPALFAR